MFGRVGKGILWILASVVIWVFIDIFVIIVGTIAYYVEDFLGIPLPRPPWVD